MKVVSAEEMRSLDEVAQNKYGLDGYELMSEAGRAIALEIERTYQPASICIICGKGNNAGDGFVVARLFHELGREVTIVSLEKGDAYSGAAKKAWDRVRGTMIKMVSRSDLTTALHKSSLIVDAILGTGIKGVVREDYAAVIREVNSSRKPVIAADIPSGLRELQPDDEIGDVIKADLTVTIGLPKTMLLTYPGAKYTGRLVVSPINFPRDLLACDDWHLNWATPVELGAWIPSRQPESNKGTYGHVGIIGAAQTYAGASVLVARAALRAGCGLATIYTLRETNAIYKTALPEATSVILGSESQGQWDKKSAESFLELKREHSVLAIGPGLGTCPGTKEFFAGVLDNWEGPAVIDADGLNLLADGLLAKVQNRPDCLLTPHPGEMARLTGKDVRDVQADRVNVVRDFAMRYGVTVLLKGTGTLVARPDGQVWLIPGAEPALAKGGTGDVLTGAIASLIAQGIPLWQAAVIGATAHLQAGTQCAGRFGTRGVLASEVADAIPLVLDEM